MVECDAYKDRKHSKSRINSVKNGEKDSQNKEAAMLEKRHAVTVRLLVYFTADSSISRTTVYVRENVCECKNCKKQ